MQAMADVLVSTDELDELYDAHMTWERWPWGIGWGWRSELNTGVVFWRDRSRRVRAGVAAGDAGKARDVEIHLHPDGARGRDGA